MISKVARFSLRPSFAKKPSDPFSATDSGTFVRPTAADVGAVEFGLDQEFPRREQAVLVKRLFSDRS
jgi:hypothetical protein